MSQQGATEQFCSGAPGAQVSTAATCVQSGATGATTIYNNVFQSTDGMCTTGTCTIASPPPGTTFLFQGQCCASTFAETPKVHKSKKAPVESAPAKIHGDLGWYIEHGSASVTVPPKPDITIGILGASAVCIAMVFAMVIFIKLWQRRIERRGRIERPFDLRFPTQNLGAWSPAAAPLPGSSAVGGLISHQVSRRCVCGHGAEQHLYGSGPCIAFMTEAGGGVLQKDVGYNGVTIPGPSCPCMINTVALPHFPAPTTPTETIPLAFDFAARRKIQL